MSVATVSLAACAVRLGIGYPDRPLNGVTSALRSP